MGLPFSEEQGRGVHSDPQETQRPLYLLPPLLFFHILTAGAEQCRHHFLTVYYGHQSALSSSLPTSVAPADVPPTFICKYCSLHLFIARSQSKHHPVQIEPFVASQLQYRLSGQPILPIPGTPAQSNGSKLNDVEDSVPTTAPSSSDMDMVNGAVSPVSNSPLDLLSTTAAAATAHAAPAASVQHNELCAPPKMHLFKTTISNARAPSHVIYTAECKHCQLTWNVVVVSAISRSDLLRDLLQGMTPACQTTVLFMLLFYVENLLHGAPVKPINTENPRFIESIGLRDSSIAFLTELGYTLKGQYFVPPDPERVDTTKLLLIMEEIALKKFILESETGHSRGPMITFLEASESLCTLFGLEYSGPNESMFLSTLCEQIAGQNVAYTNLGATTNMSDMQIRSLYIEISHQDPDNQSKYLEALTDIAGLRESALLEDFMAIDQCNGAVSELELRDACLLLGDEQLGDKGSMHIINLFNIKYSKNPHQLAVLRQALKTIQSYQRCENLKHYLHTGKVLPMYEKVAAMDVDLAAFPVGLNNIGNTCYLNSLLQFYFSLPDLRRRVFEFHPRPHSELSEREQHINKFILCLKNLFALLLWTDKPSVTPEKSLVEITLTGQYSSATFGLQHDIHECMDNVMDMMDVGFRNVDTSDSDACSLLKDLFYGITRQTLRYTDATGEHTSTKDEPFHQLIVDAEEDLYTALDAYFATQQVDFEGTDANRYISVVRFPPILTIQINRVKFDRATNSAYKSHDFLRLEKTISLERYLSHNLDTMLARREVSQTLSKECAKLQELLQSKTNSNIPSAPPLVMLEITRRIIKSYPEHCADPTIFQQLGEISEKLKRQIIDIPVGIEQLQNQRRQLYSDINGEEYRLYAVLMHEGEATFGHYWLFLYDLQENGQGRWLKYNDSLVTEVYEDEVFADTTGSSANAYALVYVRSEEFQTRVQPFSRDVEHRKEYSDRFPGLGHEDVSLGAELSGRYGDVMDGLRRTSNTRTDHSDPVDETS
ncbi:hypothetical protein BASA83_007852 [Batrachochytrium salamandrivorans]|nr:hypothetical protein BASA83_007852 [Batrachochytrium salamandrivorans]